MSTDFRDPLDPHFSLDELSDATEGLLSSEQTATVSRHLAQCPDCADLAATLENTRETLADEPTPSMPEGIFNRLVDVLRTESHRRAVGEAEAEDSTARTAAAKRTALGSFGENPIGSRGLSTSFAKDSAMTSEG